MSILLFEKKKQLKRYILFQTLLPNNVEYGNKGSQTKMKVNMVCKSIFERDATFSISFLGNASSKTSYIPSKRWFLKKGFYFFFF